jgi:uncharacterized protein (AIM24 family)
VASFRPNGKRILEVHLEGETVKARSGAMIAYDGAVTFKKSGVGGGEGLRGALKRKMTGESLDLMDMSGKGVVYLARTPPKWN